MTSYSSFVTLSAHIFWIFWFISFFITSNRAQTRFSETAVLLLKATFIYLILWTTDRYSQSQIISVHSRPLFHHSSFSGTSTLLPTATKLPTTFKTFLQNSWRAYATNMTPPYLISAFPRFNTSSPPLNTYVSSPFSNPYTSHTHMDTSPLPLTLHFTCLIPSWP